MRSAFFKRRVEQKRGREREPTAFVSHITLRARHSEPTLNKEREREIERGARAGGRERD